MRTHLIILLLFFSLTLFSQTKKSVEAIYITTPLTIDGNLNEENYKLAQPAKDFLQIQPLNGKPSYKPTEVYFFYDQTAIYVGAMLYDNKDSIFNFLSERDNIGMSDFFRCIFRPL
ncbi:MAG: hypothetical protein Q7U47_09765 [Paludibacter sp.]|nr:hypothetical protein [Paludibacter sp.]